MYIYHELINALSAHMIHINLNMIFYTHVERSLTKTTHTKHQTERQTSHSLQCDFVRCHTHRMHVCLTVTCRVHLWQNDRGLLRAAAVTRGWNGYRNRYV